MFQVRIKNYTLADSQKRQYRGKQDGYYIYPLEKIDKHYDKRTLEDYIYPVRLSKESKLEKVVDGYYAENILLEEGLSLCDYSTYEKLDLTPTSFFVKKALLLSLQSDQIETLSHWFKYSLEEREFFNSFLKEACSGERLKTLSYLVKRCREEKVSLHLWGEADKYYSSNLTDWFFCYGIEEHDLAYSRLAIRNALIKDPSLLEKWKEYIIKLVEERTSWNVELPLCIQRVLQGGVEDLFSEEFGTYFSPNYELEKLTVEQLELVFQEARCFSFNSSLLDKASLRGDLAYLNFFLKKAVKYGPLFLPYSSALDNAAFKGDLAVLEFWSYAATLFNLPLNHSSRLLRYAFLQKRVDILHWWKKYSGKSLTLELVYLAIREDSLPLLKFLVGLDYSYRKNWLDFGRRVLSFCNEEIKEWWLQEGQREFVSI